MKKSVIVTLALLVIAVAGIVVYLILENNGSDTQNTAQTQTASETQEPVTQNTEESEALTATAAYEKLQDSELTVGEKDTQYYQMIGANDGIGTEVNGYSVEIYSFDNTESLNSAKSSLPNAREIKGILVLVHENDSLYADIEAAL